jgi:hypothetical protein
MNLPSPVTVTLNGHEHTFATLPVTLIDSTALRSVRVQMRPFMKLLTLWQGESYDAAGDYTQAQVEARVLEVLGSNVKAGLEALFAPPVRPAA